ncbi:hypothetical protein BVC71_02965 [Marivivens niveibacter]|uniref:Gfo/Idh/MocA-like oxidoreductase N-terminal domain-containing protein n=1 Tax=Marivivens niveibacter TaxID=1930667 RepID=A0A251X2C8_9RHOB|nr:Gfo/Idh/MocA family oxidoreductase [Marivivens niveibacter]OUD10474.1 hypothetical protein BVC71_02965 [Marivivens niveibacter]
MTTVVLIGGGRMGHRFSQAIREAGHKLSMLFDPSEKPFAVETEAALADVHERDFENVLSSDADCFVICTTADLHVPIVQQLIEAGKKRIVVEKPLSQSAKDAIELRELATQNGVRMIVNHGRRYCANIQMLKEMDGSPELGSLRSVIVKVGGGSLGCVGTHWIDMCNNLMGGMPKSVYAELSDETPSNTRGTKFDDPGGVVLMRYDGGRRAVIEAGDDVGIVIGTDFIFERGVVNWVAEGGVWTLRCRRAEDREKPLFLYGLPLEQSDLEITPPNLISYAKAVLADAFSSETPISGLDQACDTMNVYAGLRASAANRTPVTFPLGDDDVSAHYPIP